jgi:hypothetical protein
MLSLGFLSSHNVLTIFFLENSSIPGSPGEIRTLVEGSRGPYAWPLHHRATVYSIRTRFLCNNSSVVLFIACCFFLKSISNAAAVLINWIPVAATALCVHHWILVLGIAHWTEHFCRVLVWVMADKVATEPFFLLNSCQLLTPPTAFFVFKIRCAPETASYSFNDGCRS